MYVYLLYTLPGKVKAKLGIKMWYFPRKPFPVSQNPIEISSWLFNIFSPSLCNLKPVSFQDEILENWIPCYLKGPSQGQELQQFWGKEHKEVGSWPRPRRFLLNHDKLRPCQFQYRSCKRHQSLILLIAEGGHHLFWWVTVVAALKHCVSANNPKGTINN